MINKQMIIGDIVSQYPDLIRVFFSQGMMCIGCPSSQGETLEQAAEVHGLDADVLVDALNEALKDN